MAMNLLSVPAYLLFHAVWLIHSIRRPVLLVSALCLLSNPRAAIYKLRLVYVTCLYLLLCKDKKYPVPRDDPASFFPRELGGTMNPSAEAASGGYRHKYREKTVILIRHGESTWNDTFNPGSRNKVLFVLLFIPNLLYALAVEVYYFVSGRDSDSWFFDSPLNPKGLRQADGLRKFLKKEKMRLGTSVSASRAMSREERAVRLLLEEGAAGENLSSHVVCSNLRRALSTAAVGLADRFAATYVQGASKDRIIMLPCLQEISINPDALSILPPRGEARPTWCDDTIRGLPVGTFAKLVDSRLHEGNKSLDSNGLIRLRKFCEDVFDHVVLPKDVVIAVGHSLFFRSLFKLYLPRGSDHISKRKKIVNGGTVILTLREATSNGGRREYMIDPNSVAVVYGGFGNHIRG